jgi:hypothetical protein
MHLIKFFLISLSPYSGIIIICLLSALVALATFWIKPPVIRSIFLYGIPLVSSYYLYWYAVKLEHSPSNEYGTWQFVLVLLWGIPGILTSIKVSAFAQRRFNANPPFGA